MEFTNFVNLDIEAKTNPALCEQDIVFPDAITHKYWYPVVPTLETDPIADRKVVVSIGDQKIAILCKEGANTITVTDQLSGEVLQGINLSSAFKLKTVSRSQIVAKLISLYPWLRMIDLNNVMIAGGSIATIIQNLSMCKPVTTDDINDLDFFLYGLSPEQCHNKIEYLITQIKANYPDSSLIRTQYAITLVDKNKFQIILCSYDTPSQILHSFDIGACKAGIYDNFKFITTKLGLYCLEHRITIVDPRYHSNNYAKRLIKYFDRGYSVVLLKLDMTKVKIGDAVLPYLTLHIDSVNNNRMTGDITVEKIKTPATKTYDAGLDFHPTNYFELQQCIKRFMRGQYIFSVKLEPSEFVTGFEAIGKSSRIPNVNPMIFRKYIPSIYENDNLDLNVFETISDFDYKEFMICRSKGEPYVESYLFSIYYGNKCFELAEEFKRTYAELAKLTVETYKVGSIFFNKSKTDAEWY
jgi:hypothetical protein